MTAGNRLAKRTNSRTSPSVTIAVIGFMIQTSQSIAAGRMLFARQHACRYIGSTVWRHGYMFFERLTGAGEDQRGLPA